jgi:hypothetical protein
MRQTEPTQYLPYVNATRQTNFDGNTRVECSSCSQTFPIKKGFAFRARVGEQLTIALWCNSACFIKAVPIECCGSA